MLRFFDVLLSAIGLIVLSPLLGLLWMLGLFESGSPLYCQERLGRNLRPFKLFKFRTMCPDTASMATHLVDPSAVTRLGRVLRQSKLDELPQLWNVLLGDMSLVGPRPCLPSQHDLIKERSERGVTSVRPGITGLAQVRGFDMSSPALLAATDAEMIRSFKLMHYFKYIFMTVLGLFRKRQGLDDRE